MANGSVNGPETVCSVVDFECKLLEESASLHVMDLESDTSGPPENDSVLSATTTESSVSFALLSASSLLQRLKSPTPCELLRKSLFSQINR